MAKPSKYELAVTRDIMAKLAAMPHKPHVPTKKIKNTKVKSDSKKKPS